MLFYDIIKNNHRELLFLNGTFLYLWYSHASLSLLISSDPPRPNIMPEGFRIFSNLMLNLIFMRFVGSIYSRFTHSAHTELEKLKLYISALL